MKKTLILVGLLSGYFCAVAQQFLPLSLQGDLLNKQFEFSGLAGRDSSLFILSEKCKIVFKADMNSMLIIDRYDLNALSAEVELEGVAVFGDYLMLLDEHDTNMQRIWAYHMPSRSIKPMGCDISLDLFDCARLGGIEAIAVNEKDSLCYLLEEKGVGNLFIFSIRENQGNLNLELKVKCKLERDVGKGESTGRYSDMTFDPSARKLFCIRSYFDGNSAVTNQYFIDEIRVEGNGMVAASHLISSQMHPKDISHAVRGFEKVYENNIEGIYHMDGVFYLISDNAVSGHAQCDHISKKPALFLHIQGM